MKENVEPQKLAIAIRKAAEKRDEAEKAMKGAEELLDDAINAEVKAWEDWEGWRKELSDGGEL